MLGWICIAKFYESRLPHRGCYFKPLNFNFCCLFDADHPLPLTSIHRKKLKFKHALGWHVNIPWNRRVFLRMSQHPYHQRRVPRDFWCNGTFSRPRESNSFHGSFQMHSRKSNNKAVLNEWKRVTVLYLLYNVLLVSYFFHRSLLIVIVIILLLLYLVYIHGGTFSRFWGMVFSATQSHRVAPTRFCWVFVCCKNGTVCVYFQSCSCCESQKSMCPLGYYLASWPGLFGDEDLPLITDESRSISSVSLKLTVSLLAPDKFLVREGS